MSWYGVRRCKTHSTPVLVAVVTRRKDWSLLQNEHWYRVPVRTAPDGITRFRWIAFYQTAVFGAEKWAVNYLARVRRVTRARRIDLLPDEPGHPCALDDYWRVEVGHLELLPRPIPSLRLRRIVFIPTTLPRLKKACEINDLFCDSPIEDRLYSRLKRAGLSPERQYFVREPGPGNMLDLALFCRDGNVDLECDGERYHTGPTRAQIDRTRDNRLTSAGWHILRFSGREIARSPDSCMRIIRRTVRRLGGEEPVSSMSTQARPW
jgi:very-short-patch-repair endonuclease